MKKKSSERVPAVHELSINWAGKEDKPARWLSEAELLKLPKHGRVRVRLQEFLARDVEVDGASCRDIREMVLCEETTGRGWRYWWVDAVTGSMYHPVTGVCRSSKRLGI